MTHEFINLAGELHWMHDFIQGEVAGSHLIAHYAAAERVCEKQGHEFVDQSHFGPDSGTEAYECERCGYHFSHTFY